MNLSRLFFTSSSIYVLLVACSSEAVNLGNDQQQQSANACTARGGSCKGLSPGSCANWYSGSNVGCGTGAGVGCCLDKSDAGPIPAADASSDASQPTACESAGGHCVALVPGTCDAPNSVGDANVYSCGGGFGAQCCFYATPKEAGTDAKISCASAGGQCVGLAPGACPPPKSVGDANVYDCGGGLGVQCCLP